MFLRKTIKSFGLFVLISCIIVSTQNKIIMVKATNDGSEIRLDDNNKNVDTIQPSQTYVIKLNPDGDSWKIDDLEISFKDNFLGAKVIEVTNTTGSGLFGKVDYHYLVSIWLNGVNVTEKCADAYRKPPLNYIYNMVNDWNIVRADTKRKPFSFDKGTVYNNLEVKIQKIKCNRTLIQSREASCTADGFIETECETCHEPSLETIKATGHNYVAQVNYPTVYNSGTTGLHCTKCDIDDLTSEIPQYEFNISVGGSQLKAIRLGHKLLFANTHKDAKYIPFVVPNGKSVFDIK